MSLGTAGAFISVVATFFGIVWRLKVEQGDLKAEVDKRLTRVETELTWVVGQTKERQKLMQDYYLNRKGRSDNDETK